MAGGKKKPAKGPQGAKPANTENRSPSFHGRTFVNTNVAPSQQQPSQRIVRRYDRIRQEQEARRAATVASAQENAPPEVPETVINITNPETGSPFHPRTQSSASTKATMSTNSSKKTTPVKEINKPTTLTPKSVLNIGTENRSLTPARPILPTSRDTSVAIERRIETPVLQSKEVKDVSKETPQYTNVLSEMADQHRIAMEIGKDKFNLNVDYHPPKPTNVSPKVQKQVPPPLKKLPTEAIVQMLQPTLQPTVAMALSKECARCFIEHPDGRCPYETNELNESAISAPRADSTLSSTSNEDGERRLIIDEREPEEIQRPSEFSTSVVEQQPLQSQTDQQMNTTERNPTPKVEPTTSQMQDPTLDRPLGTTSRFQPYDQADLFYWKGTAFSRQHLWNQIRTGALLNPEMREAFLQSEGARQMQMMPQQQYYAPPAALTSLSSFIVPPPPPGTQVPDYQPWISSVQAPAYMSTPIGSQTPFTLPYQPPPPANQQPLSFDQSRRFTENRRQFHLLQGPHDASMPSYDMDQTNPISEASTARPHIFTQEDLQTALNRSQTEQQQRIMEEMRTLHQENMILLQEQHARERALAQEEMRKQQENFNRLLEAMLQQPSTSAHA